MKSPAIELEVSGDRALFTDPVSRLGGEKSTYLIPTYEALKGIISSVYWKPTLLWVVDELRVMKQIRTHTMGVKALRYSGGPHSLHSYTYLSDVEYQIRVHFEWNMQREDLRADRNLQKHMAVALRSLEKGGRRDVFLGTRECQGDAEPCQFGSGAGYYDEVEEIPFGMMFHGYDYPDDTGKEELHSRLWMPVMRCGVISFPRPEECETRRFIKAMSARRPEISEFAEEASR